jgi:predicted RNA-binding protein with PUA-like domain
MVDIAPVERFQHVVTLDEMHRDKRLVKMDLLRRGNRLSIQPVTEDQWLVVRELGKPVPIASVEAKSP